MTQPVGIDVSAKTFTIALDQDKSFSLANTPAGHEQIVQRLRGREARVCIESTGTYGLDLALALHRAGIPVMVLNPRAARHFAQALMKRSKTDPVDAHTLREFAERMRFKPWIPPSSELLELRAIARRIGSVTQMMTEEKNRLHAATSTAELQCIRNDIEVNIRHFERRIERLERQAESLVGQHPELQEVFRRLTSVKGIALTSAIRIYGELCVLPADMTARQWVAHAGLDPRHVESGTFKGQTRISKAGNAHLRAALYMPALTSIRFEPHVRAFRDQLVARGKEKLQAVVAVMRKLLHAIHGMLRNGTDFDGAKFYAMPESA